MSTQNSRAGFDAGMGAVPILRMFVGVESRSIIEDAGAGAPSPQLSLCANDEFQYGHRRVCELTANPRLRALGPDEFIPKFGHPEGDAVLEGLLALGVATAGPHGTWGIDRTALSRLQEDEALAPVRAGN